MGHLRHKIWSMLVDSATSCQEFSREINRRAFTMVNVSSCPATYLTINHFLPGLSGPSQLGSWASTQLFRTLVSRWVRSTWLTQYYYSSTIDHTSTTTFWCTCCVVLHTGLPSFISSRDIISQSSQCLYYGSKKSKMLCASLYMVFLVAMAGFEVGLSLVIRASVIYLCAGRAILHSPTFLLTSGRIERGMSGLPVWWELWAHS